MPAYNAASTLESTYKEIPFDVVDEVILVDDASSDTTLEIAQKIGIKHIIPHKKNKGYGGNQKSCYDKALSLGADIVIMLHPDYQYTPLLIPSLARLISVGLYDCVLGSRILGNGAIRGGMPYYKYFFNRVLTFIQNLMIGQKLSEYHTGYRAFSKAVLLDINYKNNSNNFVFDNQMLCQIVMKNYEIGEVSCPTKYFKEASSINLKNSIIYGLGVLKTSFQYLLHRRKITSFKLFE